MVSFVMSDYPSSCMHISIISWVCFWWMPVFNIFPFTDCWNLLLIIQYTSLIVYVWVYTVPVCYALNEVFLFTITANSACSTNLFSEISASEHPPPCWPQAATPQVPEDQGGHRRTHHPPPGEEAGTHPTQVTPPISLCCTLWILQSSLNTKIYMFIEMQYLITLYCGHNRIVKI